jgi:N-acetylglutamate synthase
MNKERYLFREMDIKHYDECVAVWKVTEGMGVISDTSEAIEKYLERNPGMSFVCIDQETGKVVGTNLAGHDGRRGIMYHLAVDKEHRGNSIGKKLVELSIQALKKEGMQRCLIMVLTGNESGTEFWKSIGWNSREDLKPYSIDLTKLE